ncbi:CLUMA_CG005357, isoform G [Clunio marinus]|uniref:CLUMA_CG005357, isoform G n=1 Tax=Clunio marinus TaxID=568069 RepID=A0A1J1HUP6_9DIPT|nr:CLUMA_CG005357, isoform G [Clunio marinus]
MYKFDEEFRPPGRVFMKATREKLGSALVPRGSAITTNIDEKGVKFRHDVIHEKTVEAVITDYRNGDSRYSTDRDVVDSNNALMYSVPVRDSGKSSTDLQQVTRNKRLSTEVLGSTLETTKTSQKAPDGHRRHVTHIVRKVTTLSRAEERAQANDMIKFSNDRRTVELGYSQTQAIQPKKVKISDIVVGQEDNITAREALLRWARKSTARYPGVRVNDFTGSWRDGLAFTALIHRNRPDLIDWREARQRRVRERLETAFHVVDKEYGVTRLLDVADVDTNEPDEKSMITYLSSLYEVFPEPPQMHPLYDMDSQRRVQEYRENAQQLLYWCREKTSLLQERSFGTTLIEFKRLSSDLNKFRNEEIPPRHRDKQRLFTTYKELERYFESTGEIEIENDLRPDALEKAWNRMLSALGDREHILQSELSKVDNISRLAEKVQREIKITDQRITSLEVRISEESRRIDRLHPIDAKNTVEGLESEIRHLEPPIQEMNHDCHILKENRYPKANDLQKSVTKLHQRWTQLRSNFNTSLVQKLAGMSYPIHEKTVKKEIRTVVEQRPIGTNPYFRDLQEYTEWCQHKLKQLHAADYGGDLPSVKVELERHQQEHKVIDQFHSKIQHAERQQNNFSGDELHLYQQKLSQLQKIYAELLSTSTKRLSELDALQDFLTVATAELQWLHEREQIEIHRDWAEKNLDLPAIHRYYENLMSELEKREMHFATILDRGEALLLQQHPASKTIDEHLQALQSQWSWLLQLTLCLEVHLKHATEYHSFFAEIKDAEAWLAKRDDILNTKYSQSEFGLDQGESLLRGMQDIREELNTFGETVQALQQRSQNVVPLKQRNQPVNRQSQVQSICAYKQGGSVDLEKNETCTLIDTSGRVKWRVRTNRNVEGTVPGVCLLLPPPDNEAIEAAERLKRLFDRTVALWQKKQLRLRQNMIFATIKVVKGWDFDQFLAMGAEQRTAIRRALNDDADKLLAEGDPNDPQLRRLRREMDEVNRLFDEFEKRARAEEESKQASRIFTEECITFKSRLEEMARELDHIILSPLPRDLDSLEHAVQILTDYRRRLNLLEPDLNHLQETFRTITLKTPALKKSLDSLKELWKELNTQSSLHADRLKLLEGALAGLEENEQVISELEGRLSKHIVMPSSAEGLHEVFQQLSSLQDTITQQQPRMDRMNDQADQLGRMGVPTKVLSDLKRLHANVERLNTRWNNICVQLAERLRSVEQAIGLMKNLQTSIVVEESWVEKQTEKLQSLPTATSARELDNMLGSAIERKPKVEQVNVTGGRLLREAKIYDGKCLHYNDWLTEIRPSFTAPRRDLRSEDDPGATEVYSQRLDSLNTKYESLVQLLSQRLRTAIEVNGAEGLNYAETLQRPLKTYRVGLNTSGTSIDEPDHDNLISYSNKEITTSTRTTVYQIDNGTNGKSSLNNSEIRPSKRTHINEGIESDNKLLELPGIVDPNTGKVITVGEAIKLHLLDVRTGEILLISGERVSLEKAAEQRLINPELALKLSNHLEAAQQHLTEAENNSETAEKKIKVTTATAAISSPIKTIADAIKDGTVDPILGVYKLPNGSTITITDAYQHGLLIKNETIKIKSTPMCLADSISHGLVDQAGWVVDRNAGDKFRLDSAIEKDLIIPRLLEVVDTRNDVKVSVTKAIEMGLLNAKTGRYINPLTKEKLTLIEAKNRQLIVRPMSLKDVCEMNLIDREGLIISPTRKSQLTISDAIKVGILDGDYMNSISKGDKSNLLTLNDAIEKEIVGSVANVFKNLTTGETMTIQDAVNEGLISSVTQKSLFDIEAFKDPHSGDFLSLNDALAKDILVKTNKGFKLVTAKNKLITLNEGIENNLVKPEVNEMLNRRVGVFDKKDEEITVLDLVLFDLIDPKSGYLLEYNKKTIVPLNSAVERKMITPEGALLLSSLLNITLTTETLMKMEKRYITIANLTPEVQSQPQEILQDDGLNLSDAINQEVFDPSTGVFTIPNTDRLVSFEECIQLGLINPESMKIVDPKYKEEITVHRALEKNILDTTGHYRSQEGWLPMTQGIEKGVIILSEDQKPQKFTKTLEFHHIPKTSPKKTPEVEVTSPEPLEIIPGLIYDPSTALVINMKTGKSENLLQAVNDNLVDPELVQVVDASTGNVIPIKEAIEKGIVSPDSGEVIDSSGRKVNLIDAVKTGLLIVAGTPLVAAAGALSSLKMIFDPSTNEQIPVELAYERGLVSRDEISDFTLSDSIPRSSVISQASSFDIPTPKDMAQTPSKTVKHSTFYESEKVVLTPEQKPTPVPRKSLTDSAPKFNDNQIDADKIPISAIPETSPSMSNSQISVNEALQRGLLDLKSGTYIDPLTNQTITIQEAVNNGNLISVTDDIEKEILMMSPQNKAKLPTETVSNLVPSTSSEPSQQKSLPQDNSKAASPSVSILKAKSEEKEKDFPPKLTSDQITPECTQIVSSNIPKFVENEPSIESKPFEKLNEDIDDKNFPPIALESHPMLEHKRNDETGKTSIEKSPNETENLLLQSSEKLLTSEKIISKELPTEISTETSKFLEQERSEISKDIPSPSPKDSTFLDLEKLSEIPKDSDTPKEHLENASKFVEKPDQEKSTDVIAQDNSDSKALSNIANTAKLGLMALVGAPVLAGMAVADSVKSMINKPSEDQKDQKLVSQTFSTKAITDQNKMEFSTIHEMSESGITESVYAKDDKQQPLKINDQLNAEDLEKVGAFDKRTNSFIDPSSGSKVPFDTFIYNCGVFDPDLIYVKDFSNDNYVPLAVALEKVLIDRNTGIMVEPKTGKRIPFFECLSRKWIIQKEPEKSQTFSLQDARKSGLVDNENANVVVDGILVPIHEALNSGVLESDTISIRGSSGEIMPLNLAIESGVVDLKRGVIIDPSSGKTKPLNEAFKDGIFIEGIKCPISLEAAIKTGLYDKDSRKIQNQDTLLNVQEAVDDGIIDPNISEVKNTQLNQIVPLQKALRTRLIDDGLINNIKTGELVPLDEAVEQNLITTKPIKMTLIELIVKEFYKVNSQKILNPMIGELQTIDEGMKCGFVDVSTTLIVDEKNDRVLSVDDAISNGLLDALNGQLTNPPLNLLNAYQRGYILSSKKPISLSDAILRGMYNIENGKLKLNEKEITLNECIQTGEISSNDLIVHDPKSNDIISVNEAIKSKLLDAELGCVNEPFTSEKLTLNEAVERGIIIISKRKCSLPEAVFKGLYDPSSGTFVNTTTTEKLSTDRAIKRGFIDPQSTIVNLGGKILPFESSVESGMVDVKRGTINDEFGNKIDFREAFDRGILVEVRKPLRLYEALVKGIYDDKSGKFMDPQSGKHLTMKDAINVKLIDPNSVQIKDSSIGSYKDISLLEAIYSGVIDDQSHVNVDSRRLTLKQAFDLGILCDNKAPISLQRAIHQGTYDSQSGKIVDPTTQKKMTLHEAMRRWIINSQLPCYFNENEECLLSLGECCRLKMIDRREGVFKEPGSNVFIPLNEAMGLGLIVDIESGGFGLYEMLSMKLYDVESGRFINPSNGQLVTMADAIEEDLISLVSSLVKDTNNGAYLKLNDAIKAKIIDVIDGKYIYPDGKKIDLQEARKLGLIVSHQKLLSLENVIKMGLYDPKTGKFVDPSSNEDVNLQIAVDTGLIDGDTTVMKNFVTGQEKPIRSAIDNGEIDVLKGRVIDPESKMSCNFDVAFNKGLLVTIQKPITGKSFVRNESFDNILKSELSATPLPKEMSLEDAMKHNIIDKDKALIKDPKTGQFRPLSKALEDQNIDMSKKISIDPSSPFFAFDSNCVVYLREPETFENAVESGHLSLSDGSYNNPETTSKSNLKEAITCGFIDPDSALIKDGAKGKMIRLPEAFRKGLIDSDKFNVVDTSSSKLMSLQHAVDDAILVTPKRSLDLLEALKFNLYNPEIGSFTDPFITANKALTLQDAVTKGLIDPSTTMVRDLNNSQIAPLPAAINSGLIDPVAGRLLNDNEPIDFIKARDKGLLLPAEQRQAVIEKFALCEENLSQLLKWITEIEYKISSVGGPKERIDDLRNQINLLKQIKEDIDINQRPVASCLEQVRQIVLTGSEVLSAPEVNALENSGRELRSRVDRAQDRNGRLLKRLSGVRDELVKLQSEMEIFKTWLQSARRELEDKERALSDLNKLPNQSDTTKEFVSDVIAHQADLRFITMSAQKFVDESKDFLGVLNEFRTTLPDRLPHVEPLPASESHIREDVTLVSAQYRDLLNRANALSDRLSGLSGRQRDYQDNLEKAKGWMREIQPRVVKVLEDQPGADPSTVQDQLSEAKALHHEFIGQGRRLMDNLQQSLDWLLRSLAGQLSPSEVSALEIPVEELKDKYHQYLEALNDRCRLLDTALVQSQGVQDALDGLVSWINQSEDKFKLNLRPASLIKERLQEQIREHRGLLADLESHRASLDSVTVAAQDLMKTASNARLARKIEQKLQDVISRFEKLLDKAIKRSDFLDETLAQLSKFNDESSVLEQELCALQEQMDSRELSMLPAEILAQKTQEMMRMKEQMRPMYEACITLGKDLISKRDVTDTGIVRDKIKALENQWRNLETILDEKMKLFKQKAEQFNAYETLKDQVLQWLAQFEKRTNALASVAIDLDIVKRQAEDLKPMIKEYRDYASTIDRVNDLGTQYDALIRPDSPSRKRNVYSPIKRSNVSPYRSDGRSPSPTKGTPGASPLSPSSSGFGSRISSQEGFHISDLSPIQQQLMEINNRYSMLGVRLTDRQNEIDSIKDEVRRHQESLKTLSNFLDKIQRQVPTNIIGSKDDAEKCTKQSRRVLEEMYEKQSLLDSTRTQVRDLLKRKPDAQGGETLRVELEAVVERWKNLSDLCKDRINHSEQLRDFLDTHDNLNSWLNAKEKMLTVLGPISSDPRMVQSQIQQVQVLREEFRGQQPQLSHLQDVGRSLLDHLRESSPEGQAVSQKLQNIETKWDDLVGKLDQRANSLGAAVDSSKEFDASLNRLREALQNISDNLDSLPHDKDHQETLRKIENLERQLEGQRPLLADAEHAADELCKVLGDPASRADVMARIGALDKQYQALQRKLDQRKAETEAALRDGRQFGEACARTLGWLASEISNLTDRLLVSAHKPTLQHQIDTHEPIYREVMSREHEIIMLLNKGRDLQDQRGDRSVQRDLEKIQSQWEKLRRETVERHSRLQTCMENCKKYHTTSESFMSWLRNAEEKLANLRPGVLKRQVIDQQLRDLQTFRSEVWKKSGDFEATKNSGETFLNACDVDKDPIKAQLNDIKERWERLNNELLIRAQALEECARRLGDFNDELRQLDNSVCRCEDRLAAHDALGGAAKDPKLLERVRAIKEDTMSLKKPFGELKKLANDIGSETRASGGDADHLTNEVDAIGDRIDDLAARLGDRYGELQSAATAVHQFNEQVKTLAIDLSELESQVDALQPPAREVKIIKVQLEEVNVIYNKMSRLQDKISDAQRAGEVLVDSGFAPDTAQTRDQITSLRKTLGRLENRTKDQEDALQKALKSLEKFYDAHSAIMDDLTEVGKEVKAMKAVSSELEQIRNQQDDFRRFRQRVVEPLAHNVDGVNRLGQDLVRSAQSGVSTTQLEKDLEKMNEKWNELKEKMQERDRRLDVGLLQSGKFQEALDGFSKWLSDAEEMVDNQKPPSSDYKVVKAQLQEQKFLVKMLSDRQNSLSSLVSLGQEVAANCEPAEKNRIEKQLKDLMRRFDNLTDKTQQRTHALEQAMNIAKQFQDKFQPLNKWLDGAEKAVKAMEMVPTDEEKIQQRIREHERLHDEILGKKPDFSDLADIAFELMKLVGDDEAAGLGEKVKVTTERYTDLVQASENIGHLLDESRQGLRHLVLTYQDLIAWMESMEIRLNHYKVIPVHTEKLLEQMDHLVDLNEDIASRAPNVESTVEAGSELMKHISSDEALQLKDKLDSLQRRYGDLATKGGDYLKRAQETLPLVQQFHESHLRLVDWMQVAEATLSSGEPRETDIMRLESDLLEMRPILETINTVGPQLCQISPGEGAGTIESLVTRDNRRYEAIVEQIQRKAERLHLSKQRSKEVTTDIDELLEWFRDMDANLRDADPPALQPKLVRAQLQEHRSINDDISSQKGRVRDVTSSAKKVLRESQPNDNTSTLREKLDDLKEIVDTVAGLCADRLSILEQALPLSEHFADSHNGFTAWLNDMEHQISILAMPALRPDQIAIQQDKNERLMQSIADHKPLLDKLNKTGEALASLVADDDAAKIQDMLDSDNQRYGALKTELRERQLALEKALQESSQFSDKLEGMLRALANTADQVNQADPISAHPPKIRDQIEDNAALVDDLDKRTEAYAAVKRAATDVINKANNQQDPAVRDIKKKLEKLNALWNEVQNATSKRGASLDDTLRIAEKFWKELQDVMATLRDLKESLESQEPPAAQPQAIKSQQVALQEIRHEIDQTKPEVEKVRKTGSSLMSLCGEPDKPEVKKHIEDLDHAWDNITALYAKREENLIDAMEKAMEFHETLQNLLKFLNKAEDRFAHLGPVGSDIDAVKKQIEQLRLFKDDVDPHMVEVEALNRQAIELTERTSSEQAAAIREPLNAVNKRWENLLRSMVDRQKQLEHALLHLGQFQHALNELLVWISKTDSTLDQLKPIPGDPQLLEVELAKLKVLANDIHAHQSSVDTLNDAGRQLIETDRGSLEASTTQEKLKTLNKQWRDLLQKAADRQHELEVSLREAQSFTAEVQDMLGWLGDVDSVIGASKPVGGLPETASEQLERFMEVFNELEENRSKVESLLAQGGDYIKRQNQLNVTSSNLQHTCRTLKQRWETVLSRANDKKIKLEIALKEATEFHDSLQAFVEWLTIAEKQLTTASPVSRVLETIQHQMEEHKTLQKDVSIHREAMLLLDKKGTHLKYFSQKQDVILIKNLLVSVQHRWERVVAKVTERTRALDHGYKEAREFHDSWTQLTTWLKEIEQSLDAVEKETAGTNDPIKIKKHLEKIRETQRALSSKQGLYDQTMRTGRGLIDRAPKSDENTLVKMLNELKESWTRVCSKSVDRQRKLEEALLLSGQFSEALQALLEWLRKTKNHLSDDGPVHGDLDTVTALMEQHKQLESDLEKRSAQMNQVLKTGKDLEKSDETRETSKNLKEVQKLWEDVHSLASRKKQRLTDAQREAEKLHKHVHMLLEWLSEAEQKLKYAAALPEDEIATQQLIDIHSKFTRELREKERDKDETLRIANSILQKAHPDAIPIIKNWISIIQSRWEEISQWSLSRENKLKTHLQSLKDLENSMEELLKWLMGLESTLLTLETEELPDDIPAVVELINDHKEFMENTARRTAEIDRACKPKAPVAPVKDHRKPSRASVLRTPIRGSNQDLRESSPDRSTLGRKQSRISPMRDGQTPERDRLPHYGPRFSDSNAPEPEMRSPRAKLLWDKWRHVWMLTWDRQKRLHDHLMYLQELERVRQFSWDDWRKRFLKFMNHKKSRLTDLFRKMDKNNDGLIPRDIFIDGIINTKFDTSRMEMGAVADLFDRNGEGLIDWQEFIAALRPDWQERKPATDADKIHDEVKRLVMLCTCRQKFRVFQVGEGKYRFGDSQKLRLVRILRSTVMVRVGGGWVALDEFLIKNDPCRAEEHLAELMPIFEQLRAQGDLPCTYPLHVSSFGTAFIRGGSRSTPLSPHAPHCHPSTHWVRERSSRSIAMSRPSRSSLSASTPDSLSDNESSMGRGYTPRKSSAGVRTGLTPGGSRGNSKPNSRPLSASGSRHGSNLSLNSNDDGTQTRIPQRRVTTSTTPSRPSRLSVGSATKTNGSTRTPSGSASPAPTRRNLSGSSTPSGMQTPRKGSVEPQSRSSRGTTPLDRREPFKF